MQTETGTTYKVQRIGKIDCGIDGSDQYLLVTSEDDSVTAEEVEHEFLTMYFRDTNHAGGYFCHAVTVQKKERPACEFIVIIHHRYDV